MDRSYYLDLAAEGVVMPIGTHLVLHEHADHERILLDGERLGAVVAETAARFETPLAMPLMDLKLEKEAMLASLGIPAAAIDKIPAAVDLLQRKEKVILDMAKAPGFTFEKLADALRKQDEIH